MRSLFFAAVLVVLAPAAQAAETKWLYVLAINGGGDKLDNFASHLAHLRQLTQLLAASGSRATTSPCWPATAAIPRPIWPRASPSPKTPGFCKARAWIRCCAILRLRRIRSARHRPAARHRGQPVAHDWRAARALAPGRHLLVYVTDHGTQSRAIPSTIASPCGGRTNRSPCASWAPCLRACRPRCAWCR
jgi:hypothetical protein